MALRRCERRAAQPRQYIDGTVKSDGTGLDTMVFALSPIVAKALSRYTFTTRTAIYAELPTSNAPFGDTFGSYTIGRNVNHFSIEYLTTCLINADRIRAADCSGHLSGDIEVIALKRGSSERILEIRSVPWAARRSRFRSGGRSGRRFRSRHVMRSARGPMPA
jgi:hypothetical protein